MTTLYTAHTPSSSSVASPELCTPPPSQHCFLQVPDVFVIPPEEEHDENPPFCYYDAASESKQALSISPDIEALDVALSFYQQTENRAPAFCRSFGMESQETIVMPRRSEGRMRGSPPPARGKGSEANDVLDDSDIVEVVKVRRNKGGPSEETEGYPLTKSKSFRVKASKAFKSIRNFNVGKSGRKTTDTENRPEISGPMNGTVPHRPSTPSLPRRKSMQLSQLFSSTRNPRSASFDVPPSPTSPTPSEWSTLSRPSPALGDRTNVRPAPQPQGPQARLTSKQSFRRRVSVLDLPRLFSSSNAAGKAPLSSSSQPEETISPSTTNSSTKTCTSSYQSPPIPRSSSSGSGFLHSLSDVLSRSSSSLCSPSLPSSLSTHEGLSTNEDVEMGDVSFELRLDSLHFDSLHFDPDEF